MPHSFYKLIIDGAFKEKEKLEGLGGVFRNHNGHWIAGFQHHCSAISPLQAKLEALKEDLIVALTKGFTPLIIETDATEWIMLQLKQPSIQHNFREANKVTHKQAKEALNLPKY
ncbi:PREDICTED: uncharacterized protein LOC109228032 [Nicotiana attenuata]|uniref:uncharacterized protein LOC109228032 n=1 Tax=Nicotiana attenuata TaxID=49451 RepID=UPI000904725D|nr:PREDICTED: uncharacterized protein LOC109228032 [Nicotiana attenuata]